MKHLLSLIIVVVSCSAAAASTYLVGPSRTLTAPSKAMPVVQDGDTVLIDAGTYSGDVGIWTKSNLVIRGVGGYAHLDAAGKSAGGKAIWVVQGSNTYIENIEFSGATVVDKNGAGIRQEGAGLELRHCYFHDNEDGVLAGDNANSDILFEACDFDHNGFGDGYSHNMYINHVRSFTLRFCYIHRAKVGHEVKSRAYRTYVLYNRITDEADGTASYDIDLPNGGYAVILGNVIQKGPMAQNHPIIRFGEEGGTNPIQELYVTYNTIVSQDPKATFVFPAGTLTKAVAIDNIFAGPGTLLGGSMDTNGNIRTLPSYGYGHWRFADSLRYDYRVGCSDDHLITSAVAGLTSDGFPLTPTNEYVHPQDSTVRQKDDYSVGAFGWTLLSVPEPVVSEIASQVIPNPTRIRARIQLRGTSIDGKTVQVAIYDAVGRIVSTGEKRISDSQIELPSGLSSGLYSYRVTLANGGSLTSGRWAVE